MIEIKNISKQFGDRIILNDISAIMEPGKCNLIIGTSGSGKTTLLKMLLGFYPPVAGEILIGDIRLSNLSLKIWRGKVGAVMQDGFLFPDTIAANIAPGSEEIND